MSAAHDATACRDVSVLVPVGWWQMLPWGRGKCGWLVVDVAPWERGVIGCLQMLGSEKVEKIVGCNVACVGS